MLLKKLYNAYKSIAVSSSWMFAKKYPLNSSNIDLMDQSESTKGILSLMQMDKLLREAYEFKTEHKEQVSFESLISVHCSRFLQ